MPQIRNHSLRYMTHFPPPRFLWLFNQQCRTDFATQFACELVSIWFVTLKFSFSQTSTPISSSVFLWLFKLRVFRWSFSVESLYWSMSSMKILTWFYLNLIHIWVYGWALEILCVDVCVCVCDLKFRPWTRQCLVEAYFD